MKTISRVMIPGLALCGALAGTAGCEDSAARSRDAVQKIIARASDEFERTSAGSVDPTDPAIRPQLQGILSSLGGLNGADPGQLEAAAMLSAGIRQQLGTLDLLRVEQLEGEHRLERLVVHGAVDLAGELESLADAQAKFSPAEGQAGLDHERHAATEALGDLEKRLAELDEPIASLTSLNGADTQQADRLKQEANALYGESMSLGHLDGYPAREQAVERRRAADALDRRIADRQSELEFNYQPERSLAQNRAAMNKSLVADIDRASADLKAFGAMSTDEAQATRTAISSFSASVSTRLGELEASMSGELAQAYEQAAGYFEKAAMDAGKAGAGPASGPAGKLTAAAAQQSLARLHWTRARGLASHAATLTRLIAAGQTFGDPQALGEKLKATEADHDAAIEKAKAAITSARETLDQVTSQPERAGVDAIKNNLAMLLASLEGQQVDWSSLNPSPPATTTGRGAATPAAGNTPEAFLETIKKLDFSNPADMKRYWDMFQATSPAARTFLQGQRAVSDAFAELLAAIQQKFVVASTAPFKQGFSAGASMGMIPNPTITKKTADRATVSYSAPMGQGKQSLDLVRVGDRWMIDADSMLKGGPMAGQTDPAVMAQGIAKLADAIKALADRVKADEFATIDEVMPALMQSITQAAGIHMPDPGKFAPPGTSDK